MPKKKVFPARNLKDCLPSLPLDTGKAKKKFTVFLSRQFCTALKNRLLTLHSVLVKAHEEEDIRPDSVIYRLI